jgi:hypothetical protein
MFSHSNPPQVQEDTALAQPPPSTGLSPSREHLYGRKSLACATVSGSRFSKLFTKGAENGAKTNDGSEQGRTLASNRSFGTRTDTNYRGSTRWDTLSCARSAGSDRDSADYTTSARRLSPVDDLPKVNTSSPSLISFDCSVNPFTTNPHAEGRRARAAGLTEAENPYLWPPGAREDWAAGWVGEGL